MGEGEEKGGTEGGWELVWREFDTHKEVEYYFFQVRVQEIHFDAHSPPNPQPASKH